MSFLRNAARKLLGKSVEIIDLDIVFHKEANTYGTHGTLRASHRDKRVQDETVRFAFKGMMTPPPMTPRILDYIWEEAQVQGFVVTALTSYGHSLEVDKETPMNKLIHADRQRQEDTTMVPAAIRKGSPHWPYPNTTPEKASVVTA